MMEEENTNGVEEQTTKYEVTCIKERIMYQGRQIIWYANKLGYTKQSTEFYKIVDGRKSPSAHRRITLAKMLHTTPNKLWGICPRTGHVVALKVRRKVLKEGTPMPKVDYGYISVTKEMVKLMDKWESVFPLNKLVALVGTTKNMLVLPFVRYQEAGRAKIKAHIWEAAEVELKKAVKRRQI